jgi:hypothetical protein
MELKPLTYKWSILDPKLDNELHRTEPGITLRRCIVTNSNRDRLGTFEKSCLPVSIGRERA